MGATSFQVTVKGKTAAEAWEQIHSQEVYEHGNNRYSGSLAMKPGYEMRRVPAGMKWHDFVDKDIQSNDKWEEAYCIEIKSETVKRKVKKPPTTCQVTKTVSKGRRVWETHYLIVNWEHRVLASRTSQTEALKAAREIALKGKCEVTIEIAKFLKGGSPVVATVKPKPSKAMQTVTEVVKTFVFYGYTAE